MSGDAEVCTGLEPSTSGALSLGVAITVRFSFGCLRATIREHVFVQVAEMAMGKRGDCSEVDEGQGP
jgi:hypothetical protein